MKRFLFAAAAFLAGPAFAENVTPPTSLVIDGVPPIADDIITKVAPYADFRAARDRLVASHAARDAGPRQAQRHEPDPARDRSGRKARSPHGLSGRGELRGVSSGRRRLLRVRARRGRRRDLPPLPAGPRDQGSDADQSRRRARFDASSGRERATSASTRRFPSIATIPGTRSSRAFTWSTRRIPNPTASWPSSRAADGRGSASRRMASACASCSSSRRTNLTFGSWTTATGKMRRITPPAKGDTVFYGEARFTKDGKGLITTSDRDSEFRRLTYLPVDGGKPRVLTPKLKFDVDTFDISFDVNRIAFTTNEAGADVLRLMELSTFRELPRPPLVQGVIAEPRVAAEIPRARHHDELGALRGRRLHLRPQGQRRHALDQRQQLRREHERIRRAAGVQVEELRRPRGERPLLRPAFALRRTGAP